MDNNNNSPKRTTRASNYNSGKTWQSSADNRASSKQTTWNSKDWEKWERENFGKADASRIPFKLKNIPIIL